jgi:hypothetical protein
MGDSCKCVQGLPRSRNAWEVRWTLWSINDFGCHCCVAGAMVKAESNDKKQFFLRGGRR